MASDADRVRLKVLMIGAYGTGKTSLLYRFKQNTFAQNRLATIIEDPTCKVLQLEDCQVELQLWDTSGQERYQYFSRGFYRRTDCYLLVYDVAARSSFHALDFWSGQVTNVDQEEDWEPPPFVVVANKEDLDGQVEWSEAYTWARAHNAPLLTCSALTGHGVQQAFAEAARLGLDRRIRRTSEGIYGNR